MEKIALLPVALDGKQEHRKRVETKQKTYRNAAALSKQPKQPVRTEKSSK
jgi:hypothetical protein